MSIFKRFHFFKFFSTMIRSIFLCILFFLLGILFLFLIYSLDLFINSIVNPERKPLFSIYIIASDSMVPTLHVHDGIFIKRMNYDSYQIGDIVTFSEDSYYDGMPITHRIVEKKNMEKESIYITKGDHNSNVDPVSITKEEIYGKVLFHIPKIGYIYDFFSNPVHYLFCLLFIGILFCFLYILPIYREKKSIHMG